MTARSLAPPTGTFIAPEQRNIGMVFQSYAIWPHMTVFQNVAYPLAKEAATELKSTTGWRGFLTA